MFNKLIATLCLATTIVAQSTTLVAQKESALSFFVSGTLIQNNARPFASSQEEIEFQNPNSAVSFEANYRRYTDSPVSYEIGGRLTSRNFKTTTYNVQDILDRGRSQVVGQVNVAYPWSLSIPARIFYGARGSRRRMNNRSSGVFVGAVLEYNAFPSLEGSPLQRELYEGFQQRVVPYASFGARTKGRWVNFQIEFMTPLRGNTLRFDTDGASQQIGFKEFFWSIGIGHTLGR